MKNKTILGTLPLVILLGACQLKQDGGGSDAAAASFASARNGRELCVQKAKWGVTCARVTEDQNGFPTQFCSTGDKELDATVAVSIQEDLDLQAGLNDQGQHNVVVYHTGSNELALGYEIGELSGFPVSEVGWLPTGIVIFSVDGTALSDSCDLPE